VPKLRSLDRLGSISSNVTGCLAAVTRVICNFRIADYPGVGHGASHSPPRPAAHSLISVMIEPNKAIW